MKYTIVKIKKFSGTTEYCLFEGVFPEYNSDFRMVCSYCSPTKVKNDSMGEYSLKDLSFWKREAERVVAVEEFQNIEDASDWFFTYMDVLDFYRNEKIQKFLETYTVDKSCI